MSTIVRTEPTPSTFVSMNARTSNSAPPDPFEARPAGCKSVLTRRWTIDRTHEGDCVMTCCWEETVIAE